MYDSLSINYDRFVNWQSRLAYEMPFLEQRLKTLPTDQKIKVLDAACGTGMHAIELAHRGYSASGADFSAPMIIKAIENAASQGVSAHFKAAGFGQLSDAFISDNRDRFDALLCLGNSIPHILTEEALVNTLTDFADCLNPNGLLVIQNRNFDAVMNELNRWMEPQSYQEKDEEWVFIRFYDFQADHIISFNIITLYRKGDEGWQQTIDSTKLFPWSHQQLSSMLEGAGFINIKAYGDMTGAPFNSQTSGNLILTATK